MSIPANHSAPFGEILDAVGGLPIEDQWALVEIVQHRLAEQARRRIEADVLEARREFAAGECRPITVAQLKDEILS